MAPAVDYAEHGYPLSPVLARYWDGAFRAYRRTAEPLLDAWFAAFAPSGRAPRAGEMWRSPGHARTLQSIAESGARSFYTGEIAERIDAASRAAGGFLRAEDLAAFQPEWVTPISVPYRDHEVWELPPNGQGLVALMALNILSGWDLASLPPAESVHLQLEAIKHAFADGRQTITDPRDMRVAVADLLSPAYGEERRRAIGPGAAIPAPGRPAQGGTVYLATADADGTMVSYIQSNYMGFGSGVVIPDTGIGLQNRGHTFSLDPAAANCLEPGKRTYHTIIPGFLTRQGVPVGPFGVMGGFMQPQGHVQVVLHTVDHGRNPQATLDAPRWQWLEGRRIALEAFPDEVVADLEARGHAVGRDADPAAFGRGQIIWRDPVSGVLAGATEPRTDGTVAAF
jgi:gamma-glutamyltranspeptidase/glutathione hydrolase